MKQRLLMTTVVGAIAMAQAGNSNVFAAPTFVVAFVLAGVSLLCAAVGLGAQHQFGVPALIGGVMLIVLARVLSPIGLNELFVIFPIAVIPFTADHIRQQRKRSAC